MKDDVGTQELIGLLRVHDGVVAQVAKAAGVSRQKLIDRINASPVLRIATLQARRDAIQSEIDQLWDSFDSDDALVASDTLAE